MSKTKTLRVTDAAREHQLTQHHNRAQLQQRRAELESELADLDRQECVAEMFDPRPTEAR